MPSWKKYQTPQFLCIVFLLIVATIVFFPTTKKQHNKYRFPENPVASLPRVTFNLLTPQIYPVITNYQRDEPLYRLLNEFDHLFGMKSPEFTASVTPIVICHTDSCKGIEEKIPTYRFTPIIHYFSEPKFSKARGIEEAFATHLKHRDGIFFQLDVDMAPPMDIFDKARSWIVQNETFWNPLIVYYHKNGTFDGLSQGWGEVGMFISDILRTPGGRVFEPLYSEKTTWGGEDVDLAHRLIDLGLKPIRTREWNFIHWNHPKKGTGWYKDTEKENQK